MKYGNKMFAKLEQSKQLMIEINQRMKNNNAVAKRKRSKDKAPKKTRVKYEDAIGKINMHNTWKQWTKLKPGETLKYQSREFRKDIPDDQEKLMTRIINRKDGYDKKRN